VGTGDLALSTDLVDGTTVVTVTGEVDLASSVQLREVLQKAVSTSDTVVVDFVGLTFIDSSGLSALVDAHRRAREGGGVLLLRRPTPMLRRLLDITRLETLLAIDPSEPGPARSDDQG
jgi:anti-anti-sigma factor